jgi:hypothetical protein
MAYADGLQCTEGGRRRISDAVTGGNSGGHVYPVYADGPGTPTAALGVWPTTPTACLRRRALW